MQLSKRFLWTLAGKQWLVEEYVTKQQSILQLSKDHSGVSTEMLRRACRHHGIAIRNPSEASQAAHSIGRRAYTRGEWPQETRDKIRESNKEARKLVTHAEQAKRNYAAKVTKALRSEEAQRKLKDTRDATDEILLQAPPLLRAVARFIMDSGVDVFFVHKDDPLLVPQLKLVITVKPAFSAEFFLEKGYAVIDLVTTHEALSEYQVKLACTELGNVIESLAVTFQAKLVQIVV